MANARVADKLSLFGVGVNPITYEEATDAVVDAAEARRSYAVTALATHGLMQAVTDPEFGDVVNSIDLVTPDGQPLRWALNALHGARLRDRVYGPVLTVKVCAEAERRGISVYVFGSTPSTSRRLAEVLKERFPLLEIVGVQPDRFREATPEEDDEDVARIISSGAGIVLVGRGCPRQERWVALHKDRIPAAMMAVGAAFDYIAATRHSPPQWMQDAGLQWLHRLVQEPRRLWRRYLFFNPLFLYRFAGAYSVHQVRRISSRLEAPRRRTAPSRVDALGPAAPQSLDIGVFGARAIPSTYSGYETFLTTLLPELAARGHRVTMYCRRGEVDGDGSYRGVRRLTLPALPGKQFNTLSHGAIASMRAGRAGHDVVLAVNVANAIFCSLLRLAGQRVVLNTDGQEWLRGKWGKLARSFFHFSAVISRYSATGLISDCKAMADLYEDEFRAASTVIPYCVPAVDPAPGSGVLERFGVVADGYFVIAARLNPENNVDWVAEAYSRSALSHPLLVLGVANYHSPVADRLRALATADTRIRLLGHVNERREFLELIGSACGYLHGHSVGGTNPSLIEAMHAGAFVLALDTVFNRETLGTAGLFFSRASNDLVSTLEQVAAEPEGSRSARREQARYRATERFGIENVVDGYEEILMSVAGAPARRLITIPTRWSEREIPSERSEGAA